jgi:hypothetical protein
VPSRRRIAGSDPRDAKPTPAPAVPGYPVAVRAARRHLPPADPCRCPICHQAFRAPIVRSAHSLMGTRCLTPDELYARGWRRLAGRWMLPGPAWADRRVGPVRWGRLGEDAA